jgi:hypothetical protein
MPSLAKMARRWARTVLTAGGITHIGERRPGSATDHEVMADVVL